MECRSCTDALTALMDEELQPGEKSSVEAHLKECPVCIREYESLRFAYELTEQSAELDLNPGLWMKIEDQLPRQNLLQIWKDMLRRRWLPVGAGLAAAAVAMSFLFLAPTSSRTLESDFARFIEERERIADENTLILFEQTEFNRYQTRRNPFIRQAPLLDQSPFQE